MDLIQSTNQFLFGPAIGAAYGSVIVADPGNAAAAYQCYGPDGAPGPTTGTIHPNTPIVGYTQIRLAANELQTLGTHTVFVTDAGGAFVGMAQVQAMRGITASGGTAQFTDSTGATFALTMVLNTYFVAINITALCTANLGPYNCLLLDGFGNPLWQVNGTIVPTFAPSGLDAAGVRAAIGMAAADLDAQLGSIVAAIATRASPGAAMTLTNGERDAIANALLDLASAVETGCTPRQALRLLGAALGGVIVQTAPGVWQFKGAGVATARITASIPGDGSRPSMTLTL